MSDATTNTADNGFEYIPDPQGEAAQINEIAELTKQLQDMRYPDAQKKLRGVHPKSHGCVKAQFEVLPDLDEQFQVGLFAQAGKKYDALIRFSNASVRVEPDLKGDANGSRGMAIKVLGVEGTVLIDDQGKENQDFLMINTPAFAFANVEDYLRLTKIILEYNDVPDRFFAPLQFDVPGITGEQKLRILNSFKIVQIIKAKPVANPLDVQYFSAAPFLFGPDRVMKFSAAPEGGEKPQVLPGNPSDDYLREALTATLEGNVDVVFDFKVQVRGKEEGLGIEDATSIWDDKQFPFVNMAKITIRAPQRDINTPKALERCENLVFNPWHSLAAHQPLGGVNRLRKPVYLSSAEHRGA
ncbi:MAG: catalase family protein [SAR324 cluster bacterium]|nr:catalase family protein [SAR324 cluster bacterium]